jgi:hypothetical protein
MIAASRMHDREYFYKYMPASTAKLVLQSGRLRWSSPLLFNDPFDVPRTLAAGLTSDDIAKATADCIDAYLDQPPSDLTDFDPTFRRLLTLAKSGFPQELRAEMRKVTQETRDNPKIQASLLEDLREHWKQQVPMMRILCLTESQKHVAMWYHYADKYRGAVLGFRCTEEVDSCFRIAKQIQYLDQKPDVYTDHGIARLLCLNGMAAARETTTLATLTKAADWSYEREWRIVSYADAGDVGLFSDWRFEKVDLAFLYLGPQVSDQDATELVELAHHYPKVSVFRTSVGLDRELHFRRM